jgi:hypothetical protein
MIVGQRVYHTWVGFNNWRIKRTNTNEVEVDRLHSLHLLTFALSYPQVSNKPLAAMAGGGYVEDGETQARSAQKPSGSSPGQAVLHSLTPKQEARLCAHLDDRLLGLERDERKQSVAYRTG